MTTALVIAESDEGVVKDRSGYSEGLVVAAGSGADLIKAFMQLNEALENEDVALLNKLISRQYRETAKKLKSFLESNGKDTSDFDKKILNDFNFYKIDALETISLMKNVKKYETVAFIETSIEYRPAFVNNRKQSTTASQSRYVWNNYGGKIFDKDWVTENGDGLATYYFVKQDNMWRLHQVFLSINSLNDNDIRSAKKYLESIAENNFL